MNFCLCASAEHSPVKRNGQGKLINLAFACLQIINLPHQKERGELWVYIVLDLNEMADDI
jgi:hypothetical protein